MDLKIINDTRRLYSCHISCYYALASSLDFDLSNIKRSFYLILNFEP